MSDDSKAGSKVNQQDEPSDEVEAHGKLGRPGVADEGNDDEVEGHHKVAAPKND